MAEITRLRTHGWSVIMTPNPEFSVVRVGAGTRVTWTGGDSGQLDAFFAIPTPSKLDDEGMKLKDVFLKVVTVPEVHILVARVYMAGVVGTDIGTWGSSDLPVPALSSDGVLDLDVRNRGVTGAVGLFVRVRWDTSGRSLTFVEAGARFDDDG